jgi:hypothetical protein
LLKSTQRQSLASKTVAHTYLPCGNVSISFWNKEGLNLEDLPSPLNTLLLPESSNSTNAASKVTPTQHLHFQT